MSANTEPLANVPVARTGAVKKIVIIIAAVAALVVLAVTGLVAAFILSGGPLANEMACSAGEAPANNAQGGSNCFKEGSDLPRGYTWDPRGNYKIN